MENTGTAKSNEALIINQYQYTDVLMEEVQGAQAMETYKNLIPIVIIGLVCAFFTRREFVTHKGALAVLFAIIGIGCLITIIAVLISAAKKKSAAIRQFHETYHGKGFQYNITIEGNRIRAYQDGTESVDLRRGDVRGFMESERFFIFQLSGDQLLPLKKGSFIEGNIESCRKYLPQAKRK